jgi:hypothetical protein
VEKLNLDMKGIGFDVYKVPYKFRFLFAVLFTQDVLTVVSGEKFSSMRCYHPSRKCISKVFGAVNEYELVLR